MKNLSSAALLVASFLCVGGCSNTSTPPPAAQTPAAKPPIASTSGAPVPSGAPALTTPSGAPGGLHGVVAERLDVPNYTYLRIKTAQGDTWAAIPTHAVAVGTEVTVINPVPMQKFESKTLNRTFDVIMFAQGVQSGSAPASPGAAASGEKLVPNPHVGNGATHEDAGNVKVSRASGADAHTVAEVFDQRKTLKDKNVTVHAKVVKVTNGVLGRNWLHLRDGSGTDTANNNDLVVTTSEDVKVDDELTVSGVVHTDKDLGSGYTYAVLVEDAKITR